MLPGQFLAFQGLKSMRLSGCIHNDLSRIRQLGFAFNLLLFNEVSSSRASARVSCWPGVSHPACGSPGMGAMWLHSGFGGGLLDVGCAGPEGEDNEEGSRCLGLLWLLEWWNSRASKRGAVPRAAGASPRRANRRSVSNKRAYPTTGGSSWCHLRLRRKFRRCTPGIGPNLRMASTWTLVP